MIRGPSTVSTDSGWNCIDAKPWAAQRVHLAAVGVPAHLDPAGHGRALTGRRRRAAKVL